MLKRSLKYTVSAIGLLGAIGVQAAETITYTYDAQGRLTNVAHSGTINNNVQSTYTFDNADNRTNVTVTNAYNRVVVVPINGLTPMPIPDP